jgi:uncharacterized Zn-binding protein involved in type VI secretion
MKPISTLDDYVADGAISFPCHMNIFVDSYPAAQPGSLVKPHSPKHLQQNLTWATYRTVYMNNLCTRAIGDMSSCGHSIRTGALTVLTR